jgi:hypothetical protein
MAASGVIRCFEMRTSDPITVVVDATELVLAYTIAPRAARRARATPWPVPWSAPDSDGRRGLQEWAASVAWRIS